MSYSSWKSVTTHHKVFVSYYHKDDQGYRDQFERTYGHLFISKSVKPGDIQSDLDTDYIKHLIQLGYIEDTSVVVVLVGPKTHCRKHVDWEISAGLNVKVGGHAGLLGILLPTFPMGMDGRPDLRYLPARLNDNCQSGYAPIYTWSGLAESTVQGAIEKAFLRRTSSAQMIRNSRLQMQRNTCE